MNPGDVVLARLPVGAGPVKLRPAVLLAAVPGPFQVALLCGISTLLKPFSLNWDEPIEPADPDFVASGLQQTSMIRLSYPRSVMAAEIIGYIGRIDPARLTRLRQRLSDHLRP
jgi:mRNA interferase MazF